MSKAFVYLKDNKEISEEEYLTHIDSFERVPMFKCDGCGQLTQFDTVTVEYGFGSSRDMEREDFCSDECFLSFMYHRYIKENLLECPPTAFTKDLLPTYEPEDFESQAYTELEED